MFIASMGVRMVPLDCEVCDLSAAPEWTKAILMEALRVEG
jgi:hypothetical protein